MTPTPARSPAPPPDPFRATPEHPLPLILDGGLATTLEARGQVLDDPLWSAKVLLEAPDAVRRVHLDFVEAGADVIATVSYQASFQGFARRGVDAQKTEALLARSVALAREARDAAVGAWSGEVGVPAPRAAEGRSARPEPDSNARSRRRPLVAASVGPYGAFMADGSEYTGDYPVDAEALYAFHRRRWHVLAQAGPDLMACETIPSGTEVEVLLRLMAETHHVPGWLSFSTRDAEHLADGTPLQEVLAKVDAVPQVVAVGINCLPPSRVEAALRTLRRFTTLPLLAYPNSGETWDAGAAEWGGDPEGSAWTSLAPRWVQAGARGVGGCCRVGPEAITVLRRTLGSG